VTARAKPEEDHGGAVLAPTVSPEAGAAPELLQAYREPHPTVEAGCRGLKQPAALAPVWREQPARMAA